METKSKAPKGQRRSDSENRKLYKDTYYNTNYVLRSAPENATLEDIEKKLQDRGLELCEHKGKIGVKNIKFFSFENLHCLERYRKLQIKEYENSQELITDEMNSDEYEEDFEQ